MQTITQLDSLKKYLDKKLKEINLNNSKTLDTHRWGVSASDDLDRDEDGQRFTPQELILNPITSEEEILKFEKKNNLKIPKELKDFYLLLGNGGAGPGYGVFPLEQLEIIDFEEDNEFGYPDRLILVSHQGCSSYVALAANKDFGSLYAYDDTYDMGCGSMNIGFLDYYSNWALEL